MNRIITLKWLKSKDACRGSIYWFTDKYPANKVSLKRLIADLQASEKYDYLNWLLTNLFDKPKNVKYAIFAAELVLPIWQEIYPYEKAPYTAIEAAKAWLENPTEENRLAADAARAAAMAADAAYAAYAAYAACDAAWAAAWAAKAAARAAADAARAADDTVRAVTFNETYKKITDYGIKLLVEDK